MPWNRWNSGISNPAPNSQGVGSSIPNVTSQIPYNPSVLPPGATYTSQFCGMTAEQQFAMQQNWQQWQSYQQQYAQWHAQYGEQYKREMEVKLGGAAPSLPFTPTIPNTSNIPQYSQIVPPISSVIYTAPPPPPENDTKKPNDVAKDQPPPPPPPAENLISEDKKTVSSLSAITAARRTDRNNSNNYNKNKYTENRILYGNNERDISRLELENIRNENYQFGQSCDDKNPYNSSDAAHYVIKSCDYKSSQNNTKSFGYFPETESKSREEKIFDEQFRKWEQEFENWKNANANHPDKQAYREYEMKFEDCRRKLIERREQMRRKKKQQEHQARHEQHIQEQEIREEQIIQDHQRQKEDETKQMQQTSQENQIEEQNKNSLLSIQPKGTSVIESNVLFDEKQDNKINTDFELKIDFIQPPKKEFEIPGLDLVHNDLLKQEDEHSYIIDLEKSDVSRQNTLDKNDLLDKSCSGNEKNKGKLQKDSNSDQYERISENYKKKLEYSVNDNCLTLNKIPSLFDHKIEKPLFSPTCETPKSFELPNYENNKAEDKLNQTSTITEGESNNIQNLANALADPNVMALLSAALQNNDQISIENKTIKEKKKYFSSEQDNIFLRNHPRNNFGGENVVPNRGNEGNTFNQFGGNRCRDISIWQQEDRNNIGLDRSNSDLNMDTNSFQPVGNKQQNLRHRNSFNAPKQGSLADFNNFEDTDSCNIFDKISRRDREWDNGRNNRNSNKNRRISSNQNNRNSNMNSASSAINNDNNFEQNIKSDSNVNPFKADLSRLKKSQSKSFIQQKSLEDEYFRPTHVIDYQNKPLSEVVNTTLKETDTIPTTIVDYGHKTPAVKNISSNIKSGSFFPMKTIDYGHASTKSDLEPIKPKQSFGDFLANRTNNQKRKAVDGIDEFEIKNNNTIVEQSKSWYPHKRTLENIELPRNLLLPSNSGRRKMNNINIPNINDCKIKDKYLSFYSCNENVDAVSDVENEFNESKDLAPITLSETLINISTQNLSNQTNHINNQIKNEESVHVTKIVKNFPISEMSIPSYHNNNTILIDEIVLNPGRMSRPKNIVIILRGPPGSGKSYIAKLIKDKEIELHGSAPRLLSIDNYFMVEIDREEKCPNTGRKTIRKELVYEYDNVMESIYFEYLMKSFKKTLLDHHFNFIIVDCVNHSLRTFTEFYNLAKLSNYTPFTIDLKCNLDKCLKQNIHNRSEDDLKYILKNWNNTPDHYIKLDVSNIVASFKSVDVHQLREKEIEVYQLQCDNSDSCNNNFDSGVTTDFMKCKWDMDTSEASLARLDGTRKSFKKKRTLEDYLQMDGWQPPASNSNKKRVRWADIEEKREQDKMRAIGFVVGQTDWDRMLDPTGGCSALTQTKFIKNLSGKKK